VARETCDRTGATSYARVSQPRGHSIVRLARVARETVAYRFNEEPAFDADGCAVDGMLWTRRDIGRGGSRIGDI
jgi:hypothetical protein